MIHSSFTKCLKLPSSHATPLLPSLFPPATAPHPIHSVLPLIISRELVICITNYSFALSDVEESAKFFPPCSPFHSVKSRTLRMCSLSLRVSVLLSPLCARAACVRASADWVPPVHQVCDSGELCVLRRKWFLVFISFVLTLFDLYGFWSLFDLSLFDLYGVGTACCSVFIMAPCFVSLSEFPISWILKS